MFHSDIYGGCYYEFQYCRCAGSLAERMEVHEHWCPDSLYIDDDEVDAHGIPFLAHYLKYLEHPHSPDGSDQLCCFGINYYDRTQTAAIIDRLEADRPPECDVLLAWLRKAVSPCHGFYFLGI